MGILREQSRQAGEKRGWALRSTSLICLLLLALLTFVQVAHVHPAATDADHCPICVAMHSAAPVSLLVVAATFTRVSEPVAVPLVRPVARVWHYTLFNRPPPQEA